jgi:hypothetical protein
MSSKIPSRSLMAPTGRPVSSARRFRWRPSEAAEPRHSSEPVVGTWPVGSDRVEAVLRRPIP